MKRPVVYDDEWVTPVRRGYRMQCCGCGLVHRLDFRLVGSGKKRVIQFRARLDGHSTAAARAAKTKADPKWRTKIGSGR